MEKFKQNQKNMNTTLVLQAALAHFTAEKTKTLSLLDAALNHGKTALERDINDVVIDLFKTLSVAESCITNINSIMQNNMASTSPQQPIIPSAESTENSKE